MLGIQNDIKNWYNRYVTKASQLDYLVRRLYFRSFWNRPRFRCKGKSNAFAHDKCILKDVSCFINGNNNTVSLGTNCKLKNVKFIISGDNHTIEIGNNVRLHEGTVIWLGDNNCTLTVGDNTTVESAHIAVTEPHSRIEIGTDCMLSNGIEIRSGDSHTIIDIKTGLRVNYAQNVNIGDRVWIGANCTILKGVNLPRECVIATGSVVTKSFTEKNTVIGGVPAKIIRKNISWQRVNIYKQ